MTFVLLRNHISFDDLLPTFFEYTFWRMTLYFCCSMLLLAWSHIEIWWVSIISDSIDSFWMHGALATRAAACPQSQLWSPRRAASDAPVNISGRPTWAELLGPIDPTGKAGKGTKLREIPKWFHQNQIEKLRINFKNIIFNAFKLFRSVKSLTNCQTKVAY